MQNQFHNTLYFQLGELQSAMARLKGKHHDLTVSEDYLNAAYINEADVPEGAIYQGRGKWIFCNMAIYAVPVSGTSPLEFEFEFEFLAITDLGESKSKEFKQAAIFLEGFAQGVMEVETLSA